jgi:predicted nucleic acid-binding protein
VIRVVSDSNVYISALVFGGVPQHVLDEIDRQKGSLYICRPIVEEVAAVLAGKFGWSQDELDEFLPPLWERCILIAPAAGPRICSDSDDDRLSGSNRRASTLAGCASLENGPCDSTADEGRRGSFLAS